MPLITREGKGSKLTIAEMDGNLEYLQSLGLAGSSYVYVAANGTDVENAAELQAAYDLATWRSPSATNRITVIAAPGYYNFGTGRLEMNIQYIDLVSLDGNRSIIFNSWAPNPNQGTIFITANDVFVKGVDTRSKPFSIESNLNLLKVENCIGGFQSFSPFGGAVSGTFTNCQGGGSSFGYNAIASGTFTNCVAGDLSFGSGFSGGTASGTFTNCVSGDLSFGYNGTASGTFTDCIAGDLSFAKTGTLSGKLYYCRLTAGTFATVSGAGVTRYCLDGSNVANNQG